MTHSSSSISFCCCMRALCSLGATTDRFFCQNRFPVTWISVPGPKHTFLLVAQLLESCGNPNYVSIFKKKFRLSVCTWSLSSSVAVQGGGICPGFQNCWRGFNCHCLRTGIFLHFLSPVLLRKLVFHAQTKPARRRSVHTDSPFASPHVLGGCAALICNQIFGLYMIPVQYYGRRTDWGVQSEYTSRKLPPDQNQRTCPAEKFDHQGTMNPRGPQARLFVKHKYAIETTGSPLSCSAEFSAIAAPGGGGGGRQGTPSIPLLLH